jgi:DNA-binding MarR family transcriptional regulator
MMRRLMWQSQKHAMDTLERLGLTVPQMIVLEAIKILEGRCVMSDLVRSTYLSGATLTGIVDRLISAHLVGRERDQTDRRLVYVFLTSVGQSKLKEAAEQAEAHMSVILSNYSDVELSQLHASLNRLSADMRLLIDNCRALGESDAEKSSSTGVVLRD